MELTTYVNFAGNCAEAFRYYEQHLGGKIVMMMTHGQNPQPSPIPGEWKDRVLHARLELAHTALTGADIPQAQPMRSAYLTLTVDQAAEADRIYQVLGDGGQVSMAMQETFFATRFAQLRDRFGINWMLICPKP